MFLTSEVMCSKPQTSCKYLFAVLQIFNNLAYFYIEELRAIFIHGLNFLIRPTCHLQFLLLAGPQKFFQTDLVFMIQQLSEQHSTENHRESLNAAIQRCSFIVGFLLRFPAAAMYFCSQII